MLLDERVAFAARKGEAAVARRKRFKKGAGPFANTLGAAQDQGEPRFRSLKDWSASRASSSKR